MSFRKSVDELEGLDALDRALASDMDYNCPIYVDGKASDQEQADVKFEPEHAEPAA